MKEEKAVWIEQALASLDVLRRATPLPGLQARVMQQLMNAKPKRMVLRMPVVWLAAAGFLLLAGINGYALMHHHNAAGATSAKAPYAGGNPLLEEYFAPTSIL